jgi:type II secretory pathway component PulF
LAVKKDVATPATALAREGTRVIINGRTVMLETGVPLTEGLDSFAQQSSNKAFCEVLANLRDAIHSGEALSVAMSRWPRVFPNMMISLMKASEASGTMAEMLGRVGEYLGKERRTARQIKGALGYPLFMMGTAVVMTVFLMAFVLPRFAKIYEMRSAQLPGPTRILLSMSHFVTSQYPIYGPIIGAVVIGLAIWVRHPSGKGEEFDKGTVRGRRSAEEARCADDPSVNCGKSRPAKRSEWLNTSPDQLLPTVGTWIGICRRLGKEVPSRA